MPAAILIVSGFPAAGKSTLSRRLGADLGFAVVCRDRLVTETGLRDVQAQLPSERATMVPASVDRLVTFFMDAVLDADQGVVVDGNFNWPPQRDTVRALVERRRVPTAEICLWGDATTLKARYAERADPPMDEYLSGVFDVAVSRPRDPVAGPPAPTFELDTTDLATLDAAYPSLLANVRQAVSSS